MISVIIPSYKETVISGDIGKIFTDMGYDAQVVLSTDDEHRGKGYTLKDAIPHATGEYILFMDADLQIPPQEVKSFFKVMDLYNADAVIGNKHHPYSNIQYTLWRKIVSIGYRSIVKFLFNLPIKDTQCGFKLFKTEALKLVLDKLKTNRYAFDLETIVALREAGFRVVDAPVYVKRQVNRGSVSFGSMVGTFVDTLKIWWRRMRGWYR